MSPFMSRPIDAPAGRRRISGMRRALSHLGLLGVATLVLVAVLSGVGGTYAMWSDQQTVDAGELRAGTAALDASWKGSAPSAGNMLPGQSATREATLRNTGDVPLALSASASGTAPGFTLHSATNCDAAKSAPTIGPADVPLASSGGEAVVLRPGESITACIAITATAQLVPGEQMTFTLTIEGTQVR